jgi:hypothetical protein
MANANPIHMKTTSDAYHRWIMGGGSMDDPARWMVY